MPSQKFTVISEENGWRERHFVQNVIKISAAVSYIWPFVYFTMSEGRNFLKLATWPKSQNTNFKHLVQFFSLENS